MEKKRRLTQREREQERRLDEIIRKQGTGIVVIGGELRLLSVPAPPGAQAKDLEVGVYYTVR